MPRNAGSTTPSAPQPFYWAPRSPKADQHSCCSPYSSLSWSPVAGHPNLLETDPEFGVLGTRIYPGETLGPKVLVPQCPVVLLSGYPGDLGAPVRTPRACLGVLITGSPICPSLTLVRRSDPVSPYPPQELLTNTSTTRGQGTGDGGQGTGVATKRGILSREIQQGLPRPRTQVTSEP